MSASPIVKLTERWRVILAWAPLALTVAIWLPVGWLSSTVCFPVGADVSTAWAWLPILFSSIAFAALCGLIITRQPQNRIGWLCGAIGVLPALLNAVLGLPQCDYQGQITVPGVAYVAWFSSFFGLVISLQFLLLPLWFPDGRFQSAGWRRFALIAYGLVLLGVVVSAFWPGKLIMAEAMGIPSAAVNPFGLPFEPSPEQTRLVQSSLSLSLLGSILIGNFSLFFRWRNGDRQTRQQIKIFAFFLITIGTTYFLFELIGQLMLPSFDLFGVLGGWLFLMLLVLLWLGYPLAVGVAVLRYRMYDVDVVIRKTLTYALVVALLLIVYFGSIILLQQIFANLTGLQGNEIVTVLSTLVIAALFIPLRNRIQDVIDKRFYRKKYDAQKVLQDFAETVRDETDIDKLTAELVNVVTETMQPKSVSVWLKKETPKDARHKQREL